MVSAKEYCTKSIGFPGKNQETSDVMEKQRSLMIKKLKQQGLRITKQRRIILDVILQNECSCCKEVYLQASKLDQRIGMATVYRMVNTLKEIGEINQDSAYRMKSCEECIRQTSCKIELDDHTVIELSENHWKQIVQVGLAMCGDTKDKKIKKIELGE